MILDLIADAQAGGLTLERACKVFALAPRTVQRWRMSRSSAPARAVDARPRPYNALTLSEASAVVALIRSPQHADASCP